MIKRNSEIVLWYIDKNLSFSLKSKINAPPNDPDDQPVPKSFTRLFAFQNKDKSEEKHKKKNNLKRLQHQGQLPTHCCMICTKHHENYII